MATKDYVRRPQKKQAKKTPKKNTPWARILLAVLIVLAFVYGLFLLKTNEYTETDTSSSQQSTPSASDDIEQNNSELEQASTSLEKVEDEPVPSDEGSSNEVTNNTQALEPLKPLPVLEDEDWEYIDSLPEFSVEVDATGPLDSDREYIMQCGSFRTTQRAQELKAKLAFEGFESRIIQSDGSKGRWFRVVLGPYERKRTAEKDRHQIRRGNINGCKIW